MAEIVDRYLEAVVTHDWDAFASCLSEDVTRIGPFGDTYNPKAPYVEYISKLMPTLEDYSMHVDRISDTENLTVVELTESMRFGETLHVTPEVLIFEIGADGLISKIDIFIKRLGDPPKLV
ncbi:MAG: nuclear transport factor 2 family protein [Acidimicrobiales bacterium]